LHLKEGYALVKGKGRKARLVPFGDRTAQALWKYIRTRKPAHPGIDAVFSAAPDAPSRATSRTSLLAWRSGPV